MAVTFIQDDNANMENDSVNYLALCDDFRAMKLGIYGIYIRMQKLKKLLQKLFTIVLHKYGQISFKALVVMGLLALILDFAKYVCAYIK